MTLSGADILLLRLGNSRNLGLLMFVGPDFWNQTSDAILELAILGGVDQRVDAAICDHQNHGEVVEPAFKVDGVANGIEKEDDLAGGPANGVSAAHHQRRDRSVASSLA